MLEKTNEFGQIRISKSVIEKIVQEAAAQHEGKVALANYKGKYKPSIPGNEILFEETPDGFYISAFVVIKFATSISSCCNDMIEYIHEHVDSILGEKTKKVKIIVTGTKSRDVARRHIVFEG